MLRELAGSSNGSDAKVFAVQKESSDRLAGRESMADDVDVQEGDDASLTAAV